MKSHALLFSTISGWMRTSCMHEAERGRSGLFASSKLNSLFNIRRFTTVESANHGQRRLSGLFKKSSPCRTVAVASSLPILRA
ncbi:hypothetical protein T12_772 [Trichinella patagoniensis]|uniref:Uncharacterized protein n=1 Tax=Trichinella patagoniensis TaxID=990121 RepID=A0A0V0ZEX7_9BILA|nr:hypothetical protein T12_772 [Trichinella patagoniensis]